VARPVYSASFVAQTVTNVAPATFEVPMGYVAVVRDISGVCESPSPGFGVRLLFTSGAVQFATIFIPPGVYSTFHWEGRVVRPGPEDITVTMDQELADADVFVSGYLLTVS
jgi:hypothetical protein